MKKVDYTKHSIYLNKKTDNFTQKELFDILSNETPSYWCEKGIAYKDIMGLLENMCEKYFIPREGTYFESIAHRKLNKELMKIDFEQLDKELAFVKDFYTKTYDYGIALEKEYQMQEKALNELPDMTDKQIESKVFDSFSHDFYNSINNYSYMARLFVEFDEFRKIL